MDRQQVIIALERHEVRIRRDDLRGEVRILRDGQIYSDEEQLP